MDELIDTCARERFGLTYLYPFQRLVITNILAAAEAATAGDDSSEDSELWGRQIVILPTGAGKSLCFQLPAALMPGITLVIYPLLSLMNDQERRIAAAGFTVYQLKGGQSREIRGQAEREIAAGRCDFILTNPETLAGDDVRNLLASADIAHAVVDEAHCISEWGDTFREAYLTLGASLAAIGASRITAFTATASDRVISRIREILFSNGGAHLIRGNPDRENISYTVIPCLNKHHSLRILAASAEINGPDPSASNDALLPVWRPGVPLPLPAIIFCQTRSETRHAAAIVGSVVGRKRAFYYHAGLDPVRKKRVEEAFFASADGILAATCAYGMGVDKQNIRSVIHTYLPATAEAFLQESGRGGRDREPALSIMLVDVADLVRYEHRTGEAASATPVEEMAFGGECRRISLLRHFGIENSPCSGCDRCSHLSLHSSCALEALTQSLGDSRLRLSREDWVGIWQGRLSLGAELSGHRGLPGYKIFENWTQAELEESVDMLLQTGVVQERRGRLIPVRSVSTPRKAPEDTRDHHQPYLLFGRADR